MTGVTRSDVPVPLQFLSSRALTGIHGRASIFVRALFRPRYLELGERQWTDIPSKMHLSRSASMAGSKSRAAGRACLISKWGTVRQLRAPHNGVINCIAPNDDNKRATILRRV